MFITPERTGHSKTGDIASLMRKAVRAIKLIRYTQDISFVTSSVNLSKRKQREVIYRDN